MATVSEYLNILVGFDVPKLKAEAGKVNKELSETDKKANNLMKSFGGVRKAAMGFFAALAGTASIANFITNVVGADAALNRLSKTTGMSVESISSWSNAAERAGGSASEMQAGIAGMSKELTKFKYTGDSTLIPFLNQMGVSIIDVNGKMLDQNQIMLQLADRASQMPKEDFANLAGMNGFNQSQINLMLQGRKALEKQIAEQNKNAIVTKQQAEEAAKAEAAWVDLKQSFMGVARSVAYVLIPPLVAVAKVLTAVFTFIGNHKETLVILFALAIPKLLAFNKGFLILLRAMTGISPVLKVATFAMRGFGLSTMIALAPLLLIGTGLALLFDDFMTFQAGGDSLIPWDKIFGGAKGAIETVKDLISNLGGLKDSMADIASGGWKKVKETAQNAVQATGDKIRAGGETVAQVGNQAIEVIKNSGWVVDFGNQLTRLKDGLTYKMGAKGLNGSTIDCSGWVDAVNKDVSTQISKQLGATAAKNVRINASGGAAGIIQNEVKKGRLIQQANGMQDLDINKLKAGMIIGQTRGSHASGRYHGIGHIVSIIEENGKKYISESTSGKDAQGRTGVQKTEIGEYIRKLKGRKFNVEVVDPYKDYRSQLGGGTAPTRTVNNNMVSAGSVMLGGGGSPAFNKLTNNQKAKILQVAQNIGADPNDLTAVMSFETAGTLSPSKRNPNSSGTGLIQFMKDKYQGQYGMTREQFSNLSFEKQMDYVERYFKERGFNANKKTDVANLYTAVTGYGYKRGSKAYEQNKVWDSNKDGYIAKGEMVQNTAFKAHQKNYFDNGANYVPPAGARSQAALRTTSTAHNVHSETHIGNININTLATDAIAIAKTIPHEIKNQYSKLAHAVSSGMR